ncbi:MAG: hypothetical protein ACI9U2_003354 [Bradymonadia bacterium]|jgi:hypothetical protein
MKVDKLFTVLVMGGGILAGCGATQPKADPKPADTAEAPAPTEAAPASAAADTADGAPAKCAWY